MARGLDKHNERQQKLSFFGKDLVRRSKSTCELCEDTGVKLSIFEVTPVYEEPDYDHCIFICETCLEQLENPKRIEPNHWRCLNNTMWSEIPAVQVSAVRMLRKLADKTEWAKDLLEQAYLDEELQEWADNEK